MSDKIKIFINSNANMSRGKYAAHAVHAALKAVGYKNDLPVVVLGAPRAEVEKLAITIKDAGKTELEPGTLTAGTDWAPEAEAEHNWKTLVKQYQVHYEKDNIKFSSSGLNNRRAVLEYIAALVEKGGKLTGITSRTLGYTEWEDDDVLHN